VDLIDSHRLGCSPNKEWSGARLVQEITTGRW